VPSFCRHNRLVQNCPICSKALEPPHAPRRTPTRAGASGRAATAGGPQRTRPHSAGVTVRRLARGAEDGYLNELLPGLRSSEDAGRLADELAYAAARLAAIAADPPGLWAQAALGEDIEESLWLCFLVAYFGPRDAPDPFAAIDPARVSWASGEDPLFDGVEVGPRGVHAPARGTATIEAYRAWAARSGSQHAALAGDAGWSAERRFARAFERLALPGFGRDARFELLTVVGLLGLADLSADALHLGGEDEVTLAAKRALGIGDALLLERRSAALADATGVPIAALDLGLYNWGRGTRHAGAVTGLEVDAGAVATALGL
jgi:hypothetical protein